MKSFIQLSLAILLFITATGFSNGIDRVDKTKNPVRASYILLNGQSVSKGNPIEADGSIHKVNAPLLHLMRTKSKAPKGTILLLRGGGHKVLKVKNERQIIAKFLNNENFDVAILEYHVASGLQTRDLALADALKAFRLLKNSQKSLGLCSDRLIIMGVSSGGHLAARVIQKLGDNEQPNDLILISPAYMNETIAGTVYPAVLPPVNPSARLLTIALANEDKPWLTSCEEYTKTWKGYDGTATFHLLTDSAYVFGKEKNPQENKLNFWDILKNFLKNNSEVKVNGLNPATVPVAGYNPKRHAEKLNLVAKEKYNLVMIGNSITNNF